MAKTTTDVLEDGSNKHVVDDEKGSRADDDVVADPTLYVGLTSKEEQDVSLRSDNNSQQDASLRSDNNITGYNQSAEAELISDLTLSLQQQQKREPNADQTIQKTLHKQEIPTSRVPLQQNLNEDDAVLGNGVSPLVPRPPNEESQPGAYPRAGFGSGERRRSSEATIHIGFHSEELLQMETASQDRNNEEQQQQQGENSGGQEHVVAPNNISSLGLVEANLVPPSQQLTPDDLEAAEPMEEDTNKKKTNLSNKQWISVVIISFLAVIVTVVVVLVVTTQSNSDSPADMSSSFHPSSTPTTAPTLEATFALLPTTTQSVIYQNPDSPQSMAYEWLISDPNLSDYSKERILQRFALATFFYALKGDEWFESGGSPILVTGKEPHDGPKGPPGGRDPGPSCSDTPFRPGGPKPGDDNMVGEESTYVSSSAWLSYDIDSHECSWFSSSMAMGSGMCDNANSTVVNLHLQQNNLRGTLPPQLGLLTSLTALSLDVNQISGILLSSELGLLTHLNTLRLSKNRLGGSVPTQIGLLSNLEEFGILRNNEGPTGFTGTLPIEFWNNLSKLQILQMGPHQGAGTLPDNIGQLMPDLEILMAGFSGFTGSLPTSLGLLTNLTAFDLNEGSLTGTIPTELSNLIKVERIFLARNKLTGSLPSELGILPTMGGMWVDGNTELGGTIPSEFITGLPKLQDFKIAETSITGTIPGELCSIGWMGFECSDTLCGCSCCPC